MSIPAEFSKEAVAAVAEQSERPWGSFLDSGEPYRSLLKHNPWLRAPRPEDPLEWGKGWYYDTTVARKHPYWKDKGLPTPTRDLGKLRQDLWRWGFALIRDGLSPQQTKALRQRVAEQAEAERRLGIAHLSPAQQHVWALVNKGDAFLGCFEMSPEAIQSGPLIERLHDDVLGPGWHHLSFIANISFPGCHPQGLHQDQGFLGTMLPQEAPVLMNTIYILQDVNEVNGGTLLIPGSQRRNGTDGEYYGLMPPCINLEAPAGTVLLMEGRVFHGGAVNRSDRLRYIITNSVVKNWIRQQENFTLTISPDVLSKLSDKSLMRCGFQSTSTRGMVEGYGYTGSGRTGDPNGAIRFVRELMDRGEYRHLRALSAEDAGTLRAEDFGLGRIQQAHETHRGERYRELLARCEDRQAPID
ncbi:MAG: phytanoyl-CoA dioxygenase family protein [Gammaproteobacteria bacterium]|nr:phytanoyl-CoA dioxygenase family protein [Gammaproteobacteria bacterium]